MRRIVCIGGLDPTGGAGIAMDIRAISACGGQALPLISALTAQDSHRAYACHAVSTAILRTQWSVLTGDLSIDAIKIGVLPNSAVIATVAELLSTVGEVPVVIDPVLAAGGGGTLTTDTSAWRQLLQYATIITPNSSEITTITGCDDVNDAATACLAAGAEWVLVTGTDSAATPMISHRLYHADSVVELTCARRRGVFHGSGCLLSATIAALLANGTGVRDAVFAAQHVVERAIDNAVPMASGGQYYLHAGTHSVR